MLCSQPSKLPLSGSKLRMRRTAMSQISCVNSSATSRMPAQSPLDVSVKVGERVGVDGLPGPLVAGQDAVRRPRSPHTWSLGGIVSLLAGGGRP